jgi:hypothetical protein
MRLRFADLLYDLLLNINSDAEPHYFDAALAPGNKKLMRLR